MRAAAIVFSGLAVSLCLLACGAQTNSVGLHAEADSPMYRIHRARCGTCHTRIEPGERSRATIETALVRHRNRVRMTEADWSQLTDFLAADRRGDTIADASR